MKRNDGTPVSSDAVLDGTKRITTPGAGVDPDKVIRPSKRVKASHRDADVGGGLRKYARYLAALNGPTAPVANLWLTSKGVRP